MAININAKQENIQTLLSNNIFEIPEYQRPYSWEEEHCEKLWDDVIAHEFEIDGEIQPYFLGNIVITKAKRNSRYQVIDGQQRLITLTLFLKALSGKDVRNRKLKESIYIISSREEDDIEGLRIISSVAGTDENTYIEKILSEESQIKEDDNGFFINYNFFVNKISDLSDDEIQNITDNILENVVLLPIECDSTHDALTIFESINDRGKSLSDADIFKSQLYKNAQKEQSEQKFIEQWNDLNEEVNIFINENNVKIRGDAISHLFRCYMYLLRGEHKDISKEVSLRKFFDGEVLDQNKKKVYKEEYVLTNMKWNIVLNSLQKLLTSWKYVLNLNNQIRKWWHVIELFGKQDPFYPALIYLYKNINFEKDVPYLPKEKKSQCVSTFQNIVRYCYAKKFHKEIEGSTVPDEMYKAIRDITHKNNYNCGTIYIHLDFMEKLGKALTPNLRKGFSTIITYLNKSQEFLGISMQVEHILPKSWENNWYDKWNYETAKQSMETLGNLVLLEKIKNIKGGNHFFSKKKEWYMDSKNIEAQHLCSLTQWTYADYQERNEKYKNILKDFFQDGKIPHALD